MSAHARLSPSSCSRWSTCTASVALLDDLRRRGAIPERSSSIYAAEGTVAHAIRELCLELDLDSHHFVGTVMTADGFTFTVDDAMAECLQPGLDWIRERTLEPLIEVRVDLSPWLPRQFGTCDTCWLMRDMLTDEIILVVNDYKHGQGEPVAAVGNDQMRNYALGAWNHLGMPHVDRVLMIIDQPRAGGLKEWDIPFSELIEFGEHLKAVYADIEAGRTKFAPSEKACRWCEAKDAEGGCAARNAWLLDMFASDFDDLEGDEPVLHDSNLLTPARRWHIVKHAPTIRAWLAKLHEDSLNAGIMGNPDPGSKVIEGDLGNRYFTDSEKAKQLLIAAVGDEAYKPREIVGITEIEKLVKPGRKKAGHPETWEALLKLVDRPQGKPKLVPADHVKPAMKSLADEFDDL